MSKDEAIGRILEHQEIHSRKEPFTPYLNEAFRMAIEALKEERPHEECDFVELWAAGYGEAITYKCTSCNFEFSKFTDENFYFCPKCGAEYKGNGGDEI